MPLSKEQIVFMEPGEDLDNLVTTLLNEELGIECNSGIAFSTDAAQALHLRDIWLEYFGNNMQIVRLCDEYRENLIYEESDSKLLVYAKTVPEVICKAFILYVLDHRGDCHPWVLKPELIKEFHSMVLNGMRRR